jgi:hypothetical protein
MFAAGSIKTSKWGWDFKGYTVKYDPSYTGGGTSGCWGPLTLAPNGFYYALPRVWTKNSLATGTPANDVLCFKPGKSNNKTNKWEPAQIFLVPGGGQKQPNLPSSWPSYIASAQYRFPSPGVLAPNGLIYFFGINERAYVRLTPQADPDANPVTATQWEVFKYNQTTPQIDFTGDGTTSASGSFYSGGVLGRDGYIYLIPSTTIANTNFTANNVRQRTVRIAPRNTAINPNNVDVVELGYYNTSTGPRVFNKGANYTPPRPYAYGIDINGAELAIPSDITVSAYNSSVGRSLANAIVHPNGKIYLFGGASKRIYILDPTKWGLNTEIYTNNNIYIPTDFSASPNRAWHGAGVTGTLEKLKPGQDPNTLKIFFALSVGNQTVTTETTKKYTSAIAFDPVTETFDGSFYDNTTNEGLTLMNSPTQGIGANSSSFAHFPNGHILQSTSSPTAGSNPFSKLLYIGKNNETKFIGPVKRNILSTSEKTAMYETYTHAAGQYGWGSSVPGIKSSFGKTLYSSIWGACEITSVKGFYPRIKHFSYNDNQNYSFNSNRKYIYNFSYTANNQITIYNSDITSDLKTGYPFYIYSDAFEIDQPFIVTNIVLSGNNTVITVSGTPFTTGDDTTGTLTYGQLVEFPDSETLRIWGVDLTNSMYNVQNINIQGSSISGNNGVKTIYTGSEPFYDNGHTDLIFNPGTFTTSGVNPDVTMSFEYAFNDSDIYEIPDDLTTLPTSLWNAYFNKPA